MAIDYHAPSKTLNLRVINHFKSRDFGLCFLYPPKTKGHGRSHEHVYHICQELELNLRISPKSRIKRDYSGESNVPTVTNQVQSSGFMSDQLSSRKSFQESNVLDDYSRKGLGIEVDTSSPTVQAVPRFRSNHRMTTNARRTSLSQ